MSTFHDYINITCGRVKCVICGDYRQEDGGPCPFCTHWVRFNDPVRCDNCQKCMYTRSNTGYCDECEELLKEKID